jgi:hypothetical protein
MKLAEILSEQYYSNPRGDAHKWRQSMEFETQIKTVRNFLKEFPVKSVIYAYQSALRQNKFHPDDVKDIRRAMAKYNWSGNI